MYLASPHLPHPFTVITPDVMERNATQRNSTLLRMVEEGQNQHPLKQQCSPADGARLIRGFGFDESAANGAKLCKRPHHLRPRRRLQDARSDWVGVPQAAGVERLFLGGGLSAGLLSSCGPMKRGLGECLRWCGFGDEKKVG
jgi:hypothetical protein